MTPFLCPVCGLPLQLRDRTLVCASSHSFDLARQGYVNLLRSNRSSARQHGDDRDMIASRVSFLSRGYYEPLRRAVCELSLFVAPECVTLLDIGCGEGYYTTGVTDALIQAGKDVCSVGIDISKDALIAFSKRDKRAHLAVASGASLPLASSSVDLVLSIFAPLSATETFRVLKNGAYLLTVVPREEHLMGLKEIVYDTPYLNPAPDVNYDGFSLVRRVDVTESVTLENREDIQNLFTMTPYYYKTSPEARERLFAKERVTTPLAFSVFLHQKCDEKVL